MAERIASIQDESTRNFLNKHFVSDTNRHILPRVDYRDKQLLDHLIESMMIQNESLGFVKLIAEKYGYPVWDKSWIFLNEYDEQIVLTPVTGLDTNRIAAFFIAAPLTEGSDFIFITKDTLDTYMSSGDTSWQSLPGLVSSAIKLDEGLFDNPDPEQVEWLSKWSLDHAAGDSNREIDFRSCRVVSYEICQPLVHAIVQDPEPIVVCHTVNITVCNTSGPPAGGNCQLCGGDGGFPDTGWDPNDPPIIVPPKEDRPNEFEHISEQFFHDTYEFAAAHGFNYETLLRITTEAEFSQCTSSFAGCMFQAVFDYLDGLFYGNQVVTPGQLRIGRVNPFFYQANPELLSPILDYVQQHENDPSAVQAGRVMSEVISRGYVPGNVQQELAGLAGLHAGLVDKSHFQQVGRTHVDVLRQLPSLVQDIAPYPADVLFRDYAQVANHPDAFPIIPLIIKALAKAGAGALLDIGVQVGFEYFLGDHTNMSDAIEALDVDWWSVGSAALEANLNPKYAAFLGAGTNAVSEVYDRLAAGEELTIQEIFSTAFVGALKGFITSYSVEFASNFARAFTKYGFLIPYQKLKTQFGNTFGVLCQNSSFYRTKSIQAIWKEVAIPDVDRGFYIEDVLQYGRYKQYTWVNSTKEQAGPVDYFLGTKAVQTKSIKKIDPNENMSNIRANARKAMDQLELAMKEGIYHEGQLLSFNSAQIDICVPENMEQHISDVRTIVENTIFERANLNPDKFPNFINNNWTVNVFVYGD